jgi:hypothetical protein
MFEQRCPGWLEFIEAFVVIMYDRTTTTFPVNKARLEMLARKQRQYDAIPPTRAALLEHTKREAYQGGNVWGQSLNFSQDFTMDIIYIILLLECQFCSHNLIKIDNFGFSDFSIFL